MGVFSWQALDKKGKVKKGISEGDSSRSISRSLKEKKLIPIKIEKIRHKEKRSDFSLLSIKRKKLNLIEVSMISRQIATLLKAGIPLETALRATSEQSEKKSHKTALTAIRSRVAEGLSLADAMQEIPHAFPDYYIATVRAGERSGTLDAILARLADYTENAHYTRQKISLSLLYPMIITIVSLFIISVLLVYVVPKVVQVFENLDRELPALTKYLIAISAFLQNYKYYLIIFILLLTLILKKLHKNRYVKRYIDKFLLKLPIISKLIKNIYSARFAGTFGILLESGVSVIEAFKISANVLGSISIKESLDKACERVKEGSSLYRALMQTGYFSPIMLNLIFSGEEGGSLEKMLKHAAENQERETAALTSTIVGIFEPFMILLMGAVVLIIVLSILFTSHIRA